MSLKRARRSPDLLRLLRPPRAGYIQTAAQRPVRRLLDAPRRPARLSRGHGRRICDRDLARAALPRGLVRRSHGTFPARRQACTERDADRSAADRAGVSPASLTRLTPRRGSPSAPAGTAARRLRGRSTKRTFWRSRRRSATTGGPGYQWAALHGQGYARRFRVRPSARHSKSLRATASRPSCSRRRHHADAGDLAGDPGAQPRSRQVAWPMAWSSRHRTIRRRTVASSTTRLTADRPTLT